MNVELLWHTFDYMFCSLKMGFSCFFFVLKWHKIEKYMKIYGNWKKVVIWKYMLYGIVGKKCFKNVANIKSCYVF